MAHVPPVRLVADVVETSLTTVHNDLVLILDALASVNANLGDIVAKLAGGLPAALDGGRLAVKDSGLL